MKHRHLRHREHAPATERRALTGRVETRALTDKEKQQGYIGALRGVIPLDTDSVELRDRHLNGGRPFVERIAPKAFADPQDVMAMAGHSDATLDAFARQGVNLTIEETAGELRYEALIPDTTAGRDLLALAEKQILRGTSFEFERGAEDKWEKRADGTMVRTVTRGRLLTVNPVVWPAYDDSELSVSLRHAGGAGEHERRGTYFKPECPGVVDWYDPSLTADQKYAANALHRATYALTDALEYQRALAAGVPGGALADYAAAEVAAAAANAQAILTWLAAHGAEVNPAAVKRAAQLVAETRAAPAPAKISQPDHDRERRVRFLNLSSR